MDAPVRQYQSTGNRSTKMDNKLKQEFVYTLPRQHEQRMPQLITG